MWDDGAHFLDGRSDDNFPLLLGLFRPCWSGGEATGKVDHDFVKIPWKVVSYHLSAHSDMSIPNFLLRVIRCNDVGNWTVYILRIDSSSWANALEIEGSITAFCRSIFLSIDIGQG